MSAHEQIVPYPAFRRPTLVSPTPACAVPGQSWCHVIIPGKSVQQNVQHGD
jgi:hypothetical protein